MIHADILFKYFPDFTEKQQDQFRQLFDLYADLNAKINVISRKDMDNFYIHHVLHSLALLKFADFSGAKNIVDIGTGGGFPGIPLAIAFPDKQFYLIDSIGKKIGVVQQVADEVGLTNVIAEKARIEDTPYKYDMAVARAVAPAIELFQWMSKNWSHKPKMALLKGGDLAEELNELLVAKSSLKIKVNAISSIYTEDFFETKKVVLVN